MSDTNHRFKSEIGTTFFIRHVRYLLKIGSKVVEIYQNFKILKIEKKFSFFGVSINSVALELNSPAQIEKNWIFDFFKNHKKIKFFCDFANFVNARSQSSVGVESSRGTQNARNKPN